MPAHGQHRKSKSRRFTQLVVAAGTGGAALALPLVTAGHAAAAPVTSATAHTTTAAPASAPAPAQGKASIYQVAPGDSLSGIARAKHVDGGWKQIYSDNRKVIGADPNLIVPGQRLTLHVGRTAQPKAAPSAATTAAKPVAKPAVAPAAKPAAAAVSDSGWTKPVGDAAIGTPYHQAGSNWASGYHTGVDFLVGSGTPVHSVAAGTVVSAGADGAYGNDVIIRHADGKYTLYGHLTEPLVSAGQTVTEGQEIGISGATGNVTGPHLHFEVRTTPDYGSDIDPVAYMASHGVTI
jgi:murein DD-endopeptidase MepM/ murein hydrolase activator NlpD